MPGPSYFMDDRNERVVLVDAAGRDAGTADKLDAHRTGVLHRAFSIFVFNAAGEVLLQRRAAGKYHSPAFQHSGIRSLEFT